MSGFSRIFLDTAPIIYYVERKPQLFDKMLSFLRQNISSDYVTSVVSLAEYFPYPFKQTNAQELIAEFERFVSQVDLSILDIDRAIAMKSAKIRSEYPHFKTMDALQLAAALSSHCDIFLTNDKQLRQFSELPCIILDDC